MAAKKAGGGAGGRGRWLLLHSCLSQSDKMFNTAKHKVIHQEQRTVATFTGPLGNSVSRREGLEVVINDNP